MEKKKSRKQPTNRKNVTKDTEEADDYRLENLDDQPLRTLDELQRDSLWFKCTDEQIDRIKMGFFEKPNKPYHFKEQTEEKLDPDTIIKKYAAVIPTAETDPLYHNFSYGSDEHVKLYQWSKFDSITTLFGPIHYQIYEAHEAKSAPPKRLNSIYLLQNALIYSHFQQTSFSTGDLIKQLEILLNCVVTHIFMISEAIVFLFEWQEDDIFSLTVCFSIKHVDSGRMGKEIISLERTDLFDDSVAPVKSVMEDEDEVSKKGKREEKKQDRTMDKMREILRECKLSYIYYGYIKRT